MPTPRRRANRHHVGKSKKHINLATVVIIIFIICVLGFLAAEILPILLTLLLGGSQAAKELGDNPASPKPAEPFAHDIAPADVGLSFGAPHALSGLFLTAHNPGFFAPANTQVRVLFQTLSKFTLNKLANAKLEPQLSAIFINKVPYQVYTVQCVDPSGATDYRISVSIPETNIIINENLNKSLVVKQCTTVVGHYSANNRVEAFVAYLNGDKPVFQWICAPGNERKSWAELQALATTDESKHVPTDATRLKVSSWLTNLLRCSDDKPTHATSPQRVFGLNRLNVTSDNPLLKPLTFTEDETGKLQKKS